MTADLTKSEDLNKLLNKTIEKFGRLDILVNNAGVLSLDSHKRQKTLCKPSIRSLRLTSDQLWNSSIWQFLIWIKRTALLSTPLASEPSEQYLSINSLNKQGILQLDYSGTKNGSPAQF